MTCPKCQHTTVKKFGYYGKARVPRYRCKDCGATFSEPTQPRTPINGHTTEFARVLQLLALFTEGMSIRAISRITGLHKGTILALLNTIGDRCAALLDAKLRNLRPRYVQADEAWTFVHTKQKRLGPNAPEEWGDQYVRLALDSEAKLIMSYRVGKRDGLNAYEFIGDLNARIAERHRCQLTTDGLDSYVPAVEEHFGADVDFAQLVKQYAAPRTDGPDWFRPSSHVVAAIPTPITGNPEMKRISTSHIERTNLTLRMQLRRFTRLTNAFSKKLVNLKAAVAVFVAWYNFCRVHQTLRVTPAMEAGIASHVWSLAELVGLLDASEKKAA